MLKKLKIQNFKAIQNVEIEFDRLNVLIGTNSVGKTTILQAIDMMLSTVTSDLDKYLYERDWRVDEIKNQCSISNIVRFEADFVFSTNGVDVPLNWYMSFAFNSRLNSISLIRETIERTSDDKVLLKFKRSEGLWISSLNEGKITSNRQVIFDKMASSCLKFINFNKEIGYPPELKLLFDFVNNSESYELLAPEHMKHGARGTSDTLGKSGNKLASFIKGLDETQLDFLVSSLQKYIPNITGITAVVKSKPWWIELRLKEQYESNKISVKSMHISDGVLRLIAIICMGIKSKPNSIMLMDEIEDGINPLIATKLVKSLHETLIPNRQLIVTSHSSIMLDGFKPAEILYVYREKNGNVKVKKVFETSSEVKYMLDFMNPGEIWINTTEADLLSNSD